MSISKIFAFVLLLTISVVYSRCGNSNRTDDSKSKSKENLIDSLITAAEKSKLALKRPDSLRVYLDVSGSMKGYVDFPGPDTNATIKDVVPSVITNSEGVYKDNFGVVCKIVIDNKVSDYPRNKFPENLINGSIFRGSSTEFDKIFELVVNETGPNVVSMIVSDCIMAFGPVKVKSDKYINVNNIEILKDNIKQSSIKARNKNFTIALIKYESDFYGKYYYSCLEEVPEGYENEIMQNRPFYLCLIGKTENIESMFASGIFPAHKGIYFYNTNVQTPEFKIFRSMLNSKGITKIEGNTIYSNTPASSKISGSFYVGVKDIIISPIYASNKEEILEKVSIRNTIIASCNRVYLSEVEHDSNGKGLEDYSLFYKVTLKAYSELQNVAKARDNIIFNSAQDLEVKESSVFPDYGLDLNDLDGKTFALHKIIEGIEEAFLGMDTSIAKITIDFKKQ